MLIAIAGGALQGTEAAYLARRAGWETLLIDSNGNAIATGPCDRLIKADVNLEEKLMPHLK